MKERIDRMEATLDRHANHLTNIQKTIDQVRWMAVGMIAFYALTELGFLNAVKMGF
jgi:hypothetical protein